MNFISLDNCDFISPDCVDEANYGPYSLLLLNALRLHPESPVLVKNACLALASLLRTSGNRQRSMATSPVTRIFLTGGRKGASHW